MGGYREMSEAEYRAWCESEAALIGRDFRITSAGLLHSVTPNTRPPAMPFNENVRKAFKGIRCFRAS